MQESAPRSVEGKYERVASSDDIEVSDERKHLHAAGERWGQKAHYAFSASGTISLSRIFPGKTNFNLNMQVEVEDHL